MTSSQVHEQALSQATEQIRQLEEKLHKLRIVAEHHTEALKELKAQKSHKTNGAAKSKPKPQAAQSKTAVADMMKFEAAKSALETLGRPAKVREIANHLKAQGYGTKMKDKVFLASLTTAMDRKAKHKEIFVKLGTGLWGLRDRDEGRKENNETPG